MSIEMTVIKHNNGGYYYNVFSTGLRLPYITGMRSIYDYLDYVIKNGYTEFIYDASDIKNFEVIRVIYANNVHELFEIMKEKYPEDLL